MLVEHDERDVLLKAASIVEEGWCQGASARYEPGTDRIIAYCALGALNAAAALLDPDPASHLYPRAVTWLARHLPGYYYSRSAGHSIIGWNDTCGRTQSEVAEMMRKAAVWPSQNPK